MQNLSNDDLSNLVLQLQGTLTGAPKSFRPVYGTFPFPSQPVQLAKTSTTPPISTSKGANPSGQNGIPQQLISLAAVQTPVKEQVSTASNITVSWTYNPQDANYYSVNIWFVGYHGSQAPQLMASGSQAPLNFVVDSTGETVSIYGQTVSSTGMSAPIVFATHTVVTLSGIVGPPPAPTISQALVGTSTGYQFGFNQVILPTDDEEVIYCYKVYRASLNEFAAASLLQTVTPTPGQEGTITVTDTLTSASGLEYFYWVSAVNTAGYESTATAAQAGAVQGSVGSVPPTLNTPFKLTSSSTSVIIATSPSCFFTRSDGSKTMIGSTATTVTGLPTGNNCFFFPYWRETDQTLQFVLNTDVTIPTITGVTMVASSSQYIKTASGSNIPEVFSVEMWVKGTVAGALFDFSAPQTIGTTSTSICQAFVTSAGEVSFSIYNGTSWATATTKGALVLDSTWHHIICSYDGESTATIFVDGVYTEDSATFWQNLNTGVASTTVGYWHFGAVAGLAGAPQTTNLYNTFTMSHVALYHEALNQVHAGAHIQAMNNLGESLYLEELTYDAAVSLWKLNETSGTTAADSIDTNTGTYIGGPTYNQTSPSVTVLGSPCIAFPYNYLLAIQQQNLRNHTPLSNGGLEATTSASVITSSGGTGGGYSGTGGRGGGTGGGSLLSVA